jgi:hypothetical protein
MLDCGKPECFVVEGHLSLKLFCFVWLVGLITRGEEALVRWERQYHHLMHDPNIVFSNIIIIIIGRTAFF